MSLRPQLKPYDWIRIGQVDCVVALVREEGDSSGDCEVVFNPKNPTNHDVEWDGDKWVFCKRNDFGGYAEKYTRLQEAVHRLRVGRSATK